MTREEVVKWLESLKRETGKAENRTLWHYAESIDMAIEALKAKTDGDIISRQDAIEALLKAFSDSETVRVESGAYWHHGTVLSILKSLPSTICEDCIWHVCNYNKIDWEGEDGYISRRDALCILKKKMIDRPLDSDRWVIRDIAAEIKLLPSANPKTGEWLEVEVFPEVYDIEGVKTWGSEMQCDQCGFRFMAIEGHIRQYNYCPNCGARMGGDEG